MKKLFFFSLAIVAVSALVFYSCQKESAEPSSKALNYQDPAPTKQGLSANFNYEIQCNGVCTGSNSRCSLTGNLSKSISCACSGCKMTVKTSLNGIVASTEVIPGPFKVNFLSAFEWFMQKEYADQPYEMVKYLLQTNNLDLVETYFFSINGLEESVIISNVNAISGGVKIYDCKGSCGCREIYTFKTGTVSCSCSDCRLSVTEVKLSALLKVE